MEYTPQSYYPIENREIHMTPKTILITGASAGFGAATARKFAQEKWNLVLVARREERLNALQQELSKLTSIQTLTLDIRKQKAVTEALAKLENIDVLVNNAGLAMGLNKAQDANIEDWDTTIDTNIKGLLHCTHAVLPKMVKKNQGHIVNIGSVAGTWPYPGGNVYGATKAFVKQFSNNLRADLLGKAIRVTNLEPGLAETEFSIVRFQGDEAKAKQVYAGTQPLTPEDIAEIIYWVVSLPPHVNVNRLEVMPTAQAWGPYAIHRD